jgi:FAD/FMN-containing dehydrogenase
MLFQGLNKQQATAVWQPLKEWVNNASEDFEWIEPLNIVALPAQHLWDADFLGNNAPAFVAKDDRPNAPKENIYWKGDGDEAGQFLYAYHSMWLPADFLKKENQAKLVNALFEARQHWTVSFHFNKGLAGAPEQEIEAAKDTATNPAVLSSFALAIIAGSGDTAYVTQPDLNNARTEAMRIDAAANELRKVVPNGGSYVSESNFFEHNWQQSFWGSNYSKLLKVKKRYDPEGLFFVHHGVGSEDWSDDGFTKN